MSAVLFTREVRTQLGNDFRIVQQRCHDIDRME